MQVKMIMYLTIELIDGASFCRVEAPVINVSTLLACESNLLLNFQFTGFCRHREYNDSAAYKMSWLHIGVVLYRPISSARKFYVGTTLFFVGYSN